MAATSSASPLVSLPRAQQLLRLRLVGRVGALEALLELVHGRVAGGVDRPAFLALDEHPGGGEGRLVVEAHARAHRGAGLLQRAVGVVEVDLAEHLVAVLRGHRAVGLGGHLQVQGHGELLHQLHRRRVVPLRLGQLVEDLGRAGVLEDLVGAVAHLEVRPRLLLDAVAIPAVVEGLGEDVRPDGRAGHQLRVALHAHAAQLHRRCPRVILLA